ncbi:MAG TPA: ABC transporter ATP-binding protein [Gaiellaceae bacterium]|nr:ABC transporter ATP-binding protein [Gaiellaceae bacterium]
MERRRGRPLMVLDGVSKVYGAGEIAVHALRDVDLRVEPGEYVAIMGSSGSGKSTLMNIIGCLDVPTLGRYLLEGIDVTLLDDYELSFVRNRRIGLVFQSFNLIPRTSVRRNIELPLVYQRLKAAERHARAEEAARLVGLEERLHHVPSELSGGQQQRAAIARAVVTDPAILLADEPTGNLDTASTRDVLSVFDRLNAAGRTVVVITHEPDVAVRARRIIRISDGRVVSDEPQLATVPA